jgi:hypothetical protein
MLRGSVILKIHFSYVDTPKQENTFIFYSLHEVFLAHFRMSGFLILGFIFQHVDFPALKSRPNPNLHATFPVALLIFSQLLKV